MAAAYAGIYLLTPLRMDPGDWWVWAILFFADDLSYYCYHRAHHRIRLFWATHVVHHSSQHYNLSTALRQDWTPFSSIFFWAWLPLLGFPPWMIFLAISWNLLYQFWIHTEKIRRLPPGSSTSSTRPPTTASTTAPTSSTSTATTAAS